MTEMPRDISIITTYRCQMRCKMCDIWNNPSDKKLEISAKELENLPNFNTVNITGGEPFVRKDLVDIIEVMSRKSSQVVISTSGWHTDRILALADRFKNIGIRVSIEGLSANNDSLRGREGGFDRGIRTLLGLREMGIKNIGFGMTVSNNNSHDLIPLYQIAKAFGFEFSTASFHNSFYFHRDDNAVANKAEVAKNFGKLINLLLRENSVKSWFRALFNLGLINYINDGKRMLPCEAGSVNFFIDPYGEVLPCNGMEEKYWYQSMGNIRQSTSFEEIWNSPQADKVRSLVSTCPKNCWMVGTASPVMKKYIRHSAHWVIKNKIRAMMGGNICLDTIPHWNVGQSPLQGDLRGAGGVTASAAPVKFYSKSSFVGDFEEDNDLVSLNGKQVNE